jgi:hypothetical protein
MSGVGEVPVSENEYSWFNFSFYMVLELDDWTGDQQVDNIKKTAWYELLTEVFRLGWSLCLEYNPVMEFC